MERNFRGLEKVCIKAENIGEPAADVIPFLWDKELYSIVDKQESLNKIWYGDEVQRVREGLLIGREQWLHCKYCDYFNMG